jgi:succinyl-diaminopimelate desuccinylase
MKKDEQLKILTDLIAINTVADHEEQVAKYLSQLFDQYGIDNQIVPQVDGRSNLVASVGNSSGPTLVLAGHEDTVDENNVSGWTHSPFTPTVVGNRLYGRGTTDMKAGLAAQAIALIELHTSKVPLAGQVKFLATISEELTQGGAHFLSEKGYVDGANAIIIGEPSGKVTEHGEQQSLGYAHKGALIYTIKSIGKAAHSSTPDLGIDAIDNLINYRQAEKKFFAGLTAHDVDLGSTIYTPDVFHGGNQVNSIPDFAFEKVMVRTIPQITNNELISHLESLVDTFNQKAGYQLELKVNFSGNPVKNDPQDRLIQLTQQIAQTELHQSIPLMTFAGGTDASQFTQRNPHLSVAVFGPGNNTAHQTDEYVELSSYYKFIDLYQHIAQAYLK